MSSRAIYALSSCCLNEGTVRPPRGGGPSPAESIRTVEEARGNRGAQGTLARAAAWAPNPANPPLYLDLPTKNGEVQPAVAVKWAANSPVAMLDQYVPNLKKTEGHRARHRPSGQSDHQQPGPRRGAEAIRRRAHVRDVRGRSRQPHSAAAGREGPAVLLEQRCRLNSGATARAGRVSAFAIGLGGTVPNT